MTQPRTKHRTELDKLVEELENENAALLSLAERQNAELSLVSERLVALETLCEELSRKLALS
jgi:predicted nuclease with TOPRIM domain